LIWETRLTADGIERRETSHLPSMRDDGMAGCQNRLNNKGTKQRRRLF
jgi:hypothetical protein